MCFSILVSGQEKKPPKVFGNEDLGVPEKSPNSPNSGTPSYNKSSSGSSDLQRVDRDYAELRKSIFKLGPDEAISPEILQLKLVEHLLKEQSKGNSASYCFCNELVATKLFAPRNWEFVEKTVGDDFGNITARIDSSNKGGSNITVLWDIYVKRTQGNDFCVQLFTKKDN